jgi:hypothetical protein
MRVFCIRSYICAVMPAAIAFNMTAWSYLNIKLTCVLMQACP